MTTRVSLQTVADQAGVATSTASLVLCGHAAAQRIRPATRQRVIAVAQALDYRPNLLASMLRRGSRPLVMLWTAYLHNTPAAVVADAFRRRASERNYLVVISTGPGNSGMGVPDFDIETLGLHGIAGICMVGSFLGCWNEDLLASLSERGVRIVMAGHKSMRSDIGSILLDNQRGGWLVARHLTRQGIRRMWVYAGKASFPYDERIKGFAEGCRAGGALAPRVIVPKKSGSSPDTLCRIAHETLRASIQREGPPEGIFVCGDSLALGALAALADCNYRVGHDVAVVGFDDVWFAAHMTPPLTSVAQPAEEMGRTAAEMLLDAIEGRPWPAQTLMLNPLLKKRQTSLWRIGACEASPPKPRSTKP